MFTLTIETGNAAFEEDPGAEVARILGEIQPALTFGDRSGTVRDYNGNAVGKWELS